MNEKRLSVKGKTIIDNQCSSCSRSTKHVIIYECTEDGSEEYRYEKIFQIVQCQGCETYSFRFVYRDYESFYQTGPNDYDYQTSVETYPKAISGHYELYGLWNVPLIVKKIYRESLTAFTEGAYILAGLGFRATIEAICNEQELNGKDLKIRIDKLKALGLISKKDADRLHSIRFMGNDSAHEIQEPSKDALSVALRIIEHLIASLYILDCEASNVLVTIISDFDSLECVLLQKLKGIKKGEARSLASILGKDRRRIMNEFSDLESQLISKINTGEFMKLTLGKEVEIEGRKHQTYLIPESSVEAPDPFGLSEPIGKV